MNKYTTKYVGMDVHKETIAVAIAMGGHGDAVYYGEIPNNAEAIRKLVKKVTSDGESVSFCYEAGPCGYGIYRQLTELGQRCDVVAPSLIPRKAGDRVKTDRRDANTLTRLHRAGELTPVWVPDAEQEAMRDLTRVPFHMSEGLEGGTKLSNHYVLYGNASLEYVLDTMHKETKSKSIEGLLAALRKGFY